MDSKLIKLYYSYLLLVRRYSINTVNTYCTYAKSFLTFLNKSDCNLKNLTIKIIINYFSSRQNDSINTKCLVFSALKSFGYFLVDKEIIPENLFKLIESPHKYISYIPKYLTENEVNDFLQSIDINSFVGIRDYAIFELLYSSGLRASELANMKFGDIHLNENFAYVNGKGNKERFIVFGEKAKIALKNYILIRNIFSKNKNNKYLFLNINGKKITRHTIWERCNIYRYNTKINTTVHTFRHTFATHMYLGGADLEVLRELLGHSQLDTTCIYTHVDNECLYNCHKKYFY